MSRRDAIWQDAWRCQLLRPDKTVQSEFRGEHEATWWYENLTLTSGYHVRLQVRRAGEERFVTMKERS
jgi:hypothetical protein